MGVVRFANESSDLHLMVNKIVKLLVVIDL